MQRVALRLVARFGRILSLVLLAALGTSVLMRYAPGYFSDTRELDAQHAAVTESELNRLQQQQGSLSSLLHNQVSGWLHGDLGVSRHYGVPVSDLLKERASNSARLLAEGVLSGWLAAFALALPLSARRTARGEILVAGTTALLLALPAGVLATVCLLLNVGGPVLVLATLIAVRDFKLLYRVLRATWRAPHLLHARAQGFSFARTVRVHLLPMLGRELLALGMMSFTLALSALVPIEVVFDIPGLGQLAWSAAINRDLPVLVAVTALLAAAVGVAGVFVEPNVAAEVEQCA